MKTEFLTAEERTEFVAELSDYIRRVASGVSPHGMEPVAWNLVEGSVLLEEEVAEADDHIYLGYVIFSYELEIKNIDAMGVLPVVRVDRLSRLVEFPVSKNRRLIIQAPDANTLFDPFKDNEEVF